MSIVTEEKIIWCLYLLVAQIHLSGYQREERTGQFTKKASLMASQNSGSPFNFSVQG